MTPRSLSRGMVWVGVVGLTACELAEVELPPADAVFLVQAVMRPDQGQQWVVLERSLTGAEPRQSTPGAIPQDRPQRPVTGATVWVDNLSFPGDPCGNPVVFAAEPLDPRLFEVDGLYWAPPTCPTMRTGDTLRLRVETEDGTVVTGETTVVGARGMSLHVSGDSVALPGPKLLFNRDLDTLRAIVDPIQGRALQVDVRIPQLRGPSRRVTSIVVDTTAVTLPGNLPDLFSRGTGDDIFRAGREYLVAVALGDQNYFDFVRSGNGEVSGRGFVNRLEGGLGVFGSVVADTGSLRVIGVLDDPREGPYRMRGMVGDVAVDVDWNLYLTRSIPDSTDFSAFVTGTWLGGPIDGTMDGYQVGDTLHGVIEQLVLDPVTGTLRLDSRSFDAVLSQTAPFEVRVRNALGLVAATLTATR